MFSLTIVGEAEMKSCWWGTIPLVTIRADKANILVYVILVLSKDLQKTRESIRFSDQNQGSLRLLPGGEAYIAQSLASRWHLITYCRIREFLRAASPYQHHCPCKSTAILMSQSISLEGFFEQLLLPATFLGPLLGRGKRS